MIARSDASRDIKPGRDSYGLGREHAERHAAGVLPQIDLVEEILPEQRGRTAAVDANSNAIDFDAADLHRRFGNHAANRAARGRVENRGNAMRQAEPFRSVLVDGHYRRARIHEEHHLAAVDRTLNVEVLIPGALDDDSSRAVGRDRASDFRRKEGVECEVGHPSKE
jgi:hypothetical protein